jgi:hypothetical protein
MMSLKMMPRFMMLFYDGKPDGQMLLPNLANHTPGAENCKNICEEGKGWSAAYLP